MQRPLWLVAIGVIATACQSLTDSSDRDAVARRSDERPNRAAEASIASVSAASVPIPCHIYVSHAIGSDANDGVTNPVRSIRAGIQAAANLNATGWALRNVCVERDTYDEGPHAVSLVDGVSLIGSYSRLDANKLPGGVCWNAATNSVNPLCAATPVWVWADVPGTRSILHGGPRAVYATNITHSTVLQGFVVAASAGVADIMSVNTWSVAITVSNAPALVIRNDSLHTERGANGRDGRQGSPGAAGAAGESGGRGSLMVSVGSTGGLVAGTALAGGPAGRGGRNCGVGGDGGFGGNATYTRDLTFVLQNGGAGSSAASGSAGGAGGPGLFTDAVLGPSSIGGRGADGSAGAPTLEAGAGGGSFGGHGGLGVAGHSGTGGGGGGGGGGYGTALSLFNSKSLQSGGGGGGGGAGGCAGGAGEGGQGGGGSVGIYIIGLEQAPTVSTTPIVTVGGGDGGDGAMGGAGGQGGTGGLAWRPEAGWSNDAIAGDGGRGGDASRGTQGGGGGGGPSCATLYSTPRSWPPIPRPTSTGPEIGGAGKGGQPNGEWGAHGTLCHS